MPDTFRHLFEPSAPLSLSRFQTHTQVRSHTTATLETSLQLFLRGTSVTSAPGVSESEKFSRGTVFSVCQEVKIHRQRCWYYQLRARRMGGSG